MKKEVFKSPIGESYTKIDHDSGLSVYVCEKPEFTSSYVLFGTRYGSIDTCFSTNGEPFADVPEGIAHFLEHKLFESEDGDAFTRYAETGASANAFTSFDRTCYLFGCSDRFEDNLRILLDFVSHPYFTAQTVKKEQGIIGQEIRMYDDSPNWCVFFNLLKALYHTHPVRIDIAGTVESIAQIDEKLLYRCYETFYDPSNMFLCVCGPVSVQAVMQIVDEKVHRGKGRSVQRRFAQEPRGVAERLIETTAEVALPLFALGYKDTGEKKTMKQTLAMGMTLEVLCGDSAPLNKRLTEEALINDSFETEYFTGNGYAGVIFSGESADPEGVARAIREEIDRLCREGIDPVLFEAVRRGLYGDAIRRFNSVQDIAMQLVECAMNDEKMFDEYDLLQNMTRQDVMDCLENLRNDYWAMSVVRPGKEGK